MNLNIKNFSSQSRFLFFLEIDMQIKIKTWNNNSRTYLLNLKYTLYETYAWLFVDIENRTMIETGEAMWRVKSLWWICRLLRTAREDFAAVPGEPHRVLPWCRGSRGLLVGGGRGNTSLLHAMNFSDIT